MENQSKANISKEANRNSKLKQELLEAQENASTKSLYVSVLHLIVRWRELSEPIIKSRAIS